MIVITDSHKDEENNVTVEQGQYLKTQYKGPCIHFVLQNFKSGELKVSFRKGIKCEDVLYMEKEDTKIHLVSCALYELLEEKELPITLNTVIGDFKFSYGVGIKKIEAEISEKVLRKADI